MSHLKRGVVICPKVVGEFTAESSWTDTWSHNHAADGPETNDIHWTVFFIQASQFSLSHPLGMRWKANRSQSPRRIQDRFNLREQNRNTESAFTGTGTTCGLSGLQPLVLYCFCLLLVFLLLWAPNAVYSHVIGPCLPYGDRQINNYLDKFFCERQDEWVVDISWNDQLYWQRY